LPGTLRFFGEPAEKVCGSKPVHAAKGYYAGVDAFIAYHPHRENTTVWDTQCGSYWSAVFTFECRAPERWIDSSLVPAGASAHATARCPGAIDALCLMYTTTKYTKEAMFPHTGTWTINEFILAGGDATSDNLPPRFSQIQYSWRSPSLAIQDRIGSVLENNARHAAAVTGCEASIRWVTKTRVGLTNHALADLTYRNLEVVGPPRYDDAAREFGRSIQKNLGLSPTDEPFFADHEQLIRPEAYEEHIRALLPNWQTNYTSDDYVEYGWHAPSVRLFTARPAMRPTAEFPAYPAWTYNALGGVPAVVDPGMFVAAKTIAATLIDLLTQPDELARARAEFVGRTGGGVGGSRWVAPLLPASFAAPVDLRWPEYITTQRGEEWWIPTPVDRNGDRL
jgi:aminobenzoyl-glutamate utilization protein B